MFTCFRRFRCLVGPAAVTIHDSVTPKTSSCLVLQNNQQTSSWSITLMVVVGHGMRAGATATHNTWLYRPRRVIKVLVECICLWVSGLNRESPLSSTLPVNALLCLFVCACLQYKLMDGWILSTSTYSSRFFVLPTLYFLVSRKF